MVGSNTVSVKKYRSDTAWVGPNGMVWISPDRYTNPSQSAD